VHAGSKRRARTSTSVHAADEATDDAAPSALTAASFSLPRSSGSALANAAPLVSQEAPLATSAKLRRSGGAGSASDSDFSPDGPPEPDVAWSRRSHPPRGAAPSEPRRRQLPNSVTKELMAWFLSHSDNPYPSAGELLLPSLIALPWSAVRVLACVQRAVLAFATISAEDKAILMKKSGLDATQLRNYFTNLRKR
jgi:hypothetical protein